MQIISIYSPKGGVGKTTIAMQLAGAYTKEGKRVVVVDADEQESATTIYHTKAGEQQPAFEVVSDFPKSVEGVDVMLIDHHPSHKNVPLSGFVVVPLQGSRLDWESYQKAQHLFAEKQHMLVVNRIDDRLKDLARFSRHLATKYNAMKMKERTIYRKSTDEATTVFGVDAKRYGVTDARREIIKIKDQIDTAMGAL